MYYIALNVLHNMNTSRMKLYRGMRNCFADGSEITPKRILELGHESGLPEYITRYEYDGCMYANFIVIQNHTKRLSEKAKIDFGLYDSDARYKLSEIPITIDIFPDFLELKMNRVDTVDKVCEDKLLTAKWSRNKSLQRYRKKADSYAKLRYMIEELMEIFGNRGAYEGNIEELLKLYGKKRENSADWNAWINFRGCYLSNTLLKYEPIYSDIFAYTDKAVEWGGKEFIVQNLKEICCKAGNQFDEFMEAAVEDGMIRETGTDRYAITGHAATIHKCCKSGFHLNRLSIILRKRGTDRFELLIGDNSLYSEKVKTSIYSNTEETENHWLVYKTDEIGKIITKLINIIASFEIYQEVISLT